VTGGVLALAACAVEGGPAVLASVPSATAVAPARPGFLAAPTDQLAVPGLLAGAEVTPEGDVYTGAAEYAFRFGPRLRGWDVPTRSLAGGRYPVLGSEAVAGGVRYRMTALIDAVAGEPVVFVHVALRNLAGRRVHARWSTATLWSGGRREPDGRYAFRYPRPATPTIPGLYTQPGVAFDPAATYAVSDGAATRDGQVLYTFSGSPSIGGAPHAATPATQVARTTYRVSLGPGAGASVDVRMPVRPAAMSGPQVAAVRAAPFAAHRAAVLAAWRARLAAGMRLRLPETGVRDAYEASLVHMLEPRYQLADGQWVQAVNKLQYQAFWLRDTAIIAAALDLAGLHGPAEQDLDFFGAWQRPDGLFISRVGQMDGLGEALWALGEHVRLTGDAGFAAAHLDEVQRAMAWLASARAGDPLGLVPPSDPHDDELVAGHLPGDDFWAVAGADAAAALADAAGRPDLAATWRTQRDDLRAATVAALRRHGGAIPPALDAPGGHDWGNLWAAWPYPVLAPDDGQVTATLRAVRRRFAEGIATYGASLHGYLGFRVFETELERGDQHAVVDGLYASLAHLTATDGCFELGTRPYGRRLVSDDLAPHAWCAAEIVTLVRNMLVRERADGVQLMSALSPAWLGGGRRVAFERAPTAVGPVDASLRSTETGATLTWRAPAGVPVWWTVPADADAVRIDGHLVAGSLVRLPTASGRLRIAWRLRRDDRSLARTQRALAAAYRAHARPAPF
jgi:hypothetical protein